MTATFPRVTGTMASTLASTARSSTRRVLAVTSSSSTLTSINPPVVKSVSKDLVSFLDTSTSTTTKLTSTSLLTQPIMTLSTTMLPSTVHAMAVPNKVSPSLNSISKDVSVSLERANKSALDLLQTLNVMVNRSGGTESSTENFKSTPAVPISVTVQDMIQMENQLNQTISKGTDIMVVYIVISASACTIFMLLFGGLIYFFVHRSSVRLDITPKRKTIKIPSKFNEQLVRLRKAESSSCLTNANFSMPVSAILPVQVNLAGPSNSMDGGYMVPNQHLPLSTFVNRVRGFDSYANMSEVQIHVPPPPLPIRPPNLVRFSNGASISSFSEVSGSLASSVSLPVSSISGRSTPFDESGSSFSVTPVNAEYDLVTPDPVSDRNSLTSRTLSRLVNRSDICTSPSVSSVMDTAL